MRNTLFAGIGGVVIGALAGLFVLSPFVAPDSKQSADPDSSVVQGGRGFTGMQVQGLTPQAASALGQVKAEGVLVRDVGLGSPADRAGIRRGDLIVRFDGQMIDTFDRLIATVGKLKAGEKANVVIRRNKKKVTLTLQAGSWPASLLIDQAAQAQIKEIGISFASITKKVRDGFGLRWGTSGVVVTKVDETLSNKIGLKPGDVILQVNQRNVWSPRHVVEEIRKARAAKRETVLLLVEGSAPGRNGFRFMLLPVR